MAGEAANERLCPGSVNAPLLVQERLVRFHVLDLGDELGVPAELNRVDDVALQHHRELPHVGRVHDVASDGRQAGGGELVHVASRHDAEVVGLLDVCGGRKADRVGLPLHDVAVRVGGLSQGHVHAGRAEAADSSEGGRHDVWLSLAVIRSHYPCRVREREGLRPQGPFHVAPPCFVAALLPRLTPEPHSAPNRRLRTRAADSTPFHARRQPSTRHRPCPMP